MHRMLLKLLLCLILIGSIGYFITNAENSTSSTINRITIEDEPGEDKEGIVLSFRQITLLPHNSAEEANQTNELVVKNRPGFDANVFRNNDFLATFKAHKGGSYHTLTAIMNSLLNQLKKRIHGGAI